MKPSRFLTAICLLATALAVGSCTQGEGMDGNVQNLPEGMYPLTFTATQGEPVASPQTRVSDYDDTDGSHKSKWTTDDRIKVVVSGGSNDMETTCTLAENGNITNYNPQLYWKTTQTSKINAWYSNITGHATVTDNTVNLADQRSGLAYVLKAEEVTGVNYKSGNISLRFKHQLAKVRVKLVKDTYEGDLSNATVKINSQYTSCTVNNGVVTVGSTTGDIPMHQAAYGGDTYYEANVVPGKALKDKAFTITAGGKTTQANLESEITLTAGNVYTLTITVKGPATEVNISDISGTEYTVEGNILLKGDGQSKDLKLIVEAGSNLTIENVVLEPEGVNVITCKGDATITLKGENTLNATYSGNECSGILVESGTVTIEGDDNAKLTVKGGAGTYGAGIGATNKANITIKGGNIIANQNGVHESAGIGSAGQGKTCGTITITGGIIESWGGNYSAGIGGSNSGPCGDIIITGGNIQAYGGSQSAGIGNGDYASCGTITISGASTVVYAKKGSGKGLGKTPSPIGWNNYNGSCGEVTIAAECDVTQI